MDIDNILEKMSTKVDKGKNYLKGLFNKSVAEYDEQFGDALSDDRKALMSVLKIGKKYGLSKENIDTFINQDDIAESMEVNKEVLDRLGEDEEHIPEIDDDIIKEELNDYIPEGDIYIETIEEAGFTETDDVDHGEGGNSDWGRFLSAIPDPTKPTKEYEKTPSLIIEIGATYYMKHTHPKDVPYSHEFDGKWGLYTKHAFKVTLIKVSDEDLYDEVYKFGDYEGQPAYVDGKNYTLWLDDKAVGYYKMFWKQITDDGLPDDRVFTYKFNKKNGYNIHTYKLPKK